MQKKIIIFGCGGHAKIILDCIETTKKYKPIGFIDEKNFDIPFSKKIKYLGSIKDFNKIIKNYNLKTTFGIVGIHSNIVRRKIVKKISKLNKNFKWANIIHPSAVISKTAKLGSGNMILAGSIICSETVIHNHVSINTGTYIDHNNIFHNFSSTGPGVTTGGNVVIGHDSFLGIGCAVRHKILIGNNTVVGGQSFVCKNCKSNSLYYGVPSKRIKKRNPDDIYL
tara:strand:+ start:574 stop:1245 length:672 start_codon:yes stop_codon:yes gene_type:complete